MYHGSSKALCSAIARMARRIATETVHPQCLQSFIACRLIPLSKSPGVRPIRICETLRRIIGKAIMKLVGPEIQSVEGTSQLCAGQKSGCEIAVHLMKKLYYGDIEGVLLVDATNAFNSLNQCFSYCRFFASWDASSSIWTQVESFGRFLCVKT